MSNPHLTRIIYNSHAFIKKNSDPFSFKVDLDAKHFQKLPRLVDIAIRRVTFALRKPLNKSIAVALVSDLYIPGQKTLCSRVHVDEGEGGRIDLFFLKKDSSSSEFVDIVFDTPTFGTVNRESLASTNFFLYDLTREKKLDGYIDFETPFCIFVDVKTMSKTNLNLTKENFIVSSNDKNSIQLHPNNSPSSFTALPKRYFDLRRDVNWFLSLKSGQIPNRFFNLQDESFNITINVVKRKVLVSNFENSYEDDIDIDILDNKEITIYPQPGCYLSISSLINVINQSFIEEKLLDENKIYCGFTNKVAKIYQGDKIYHKMHIINDKFDKKFFSTCFEILRGINKDNQNYSTENIPLGSDEEIKNFINSLINNKKLYSFNIEKFKEDKLLIVITRSQTENEEIEKSMKTKTDYIETNYYINMSEKMSKLCGFDFEILHDEEEEVDKDILIIADRKPQFFEYYPKHYFLCSNVVEKSLVGKNYIPYFYHSTIKNPHKFKNINIAGTSTLTKLTCNYMQGIKIFICDINGKEIKIANSNSNSNSNNDACSWFQLQLVPIEEKK